MTNIERFGRRIRLGLARLRRRRPRRDAELCTDHLSENIGTRAARGGVLTLLAQAIKLAVQLGAVVILARLLPPAAFGLVAMVMALNAFLEPLKELGLSSATIQKPDLTHADVSALFWINAAVGLAVTLALWAAAPWIAAFYQQPELIAVTRWLSLGFAIGGVGAQHWALLRRQMRFGTVAILETAAEVTAFAVAIALALDGAGLWALVAQRLIGPALIVGGGWALCRWRPSLPARAPNLRPLVGYGASLTSTALLMSLSRSLDQILIGWFAGPVVLGLYERASKLLMVPLSNISLPFYSIGLPLISRLCATPDRYRKNFTELFEKLAMVVVPLGVFTALAADWITVLLFGPEWTSAAPVVAWFGLAIAYQPLISAVTLLFMSQDRAGELMAAMALDTAVAIASVCIGIPFGATGVAAAIAIGGACIRTPAVFFLATWRGPVRWSDLWQAIAPSVLGTAASAGALWAVRHLAGHPSSPGNGLMGAALAASVAAVLVYAIIPKTRRTIFDVVKLPQLLLNSGT